jgi:hypothetical protein
MASNGGHFSVTGVWRRTFVGGFGMVARRAIATFLLTMSATAVGLSLPVYAAMLLPHCNRPDESERLNRHTERHYIENPGAIGRPEVSFYSYSFLHPPLANTHHIRNSVCNTHQANSLSFKWEPIGLANPDLPSGECWCLPSPLNLSHDQIEVLDPNAAYIQFINTSSRNRLSALAFVRKEKPTDVSPLDNFFDVIIRGVDKIFKERIRLLSSWTNNRITLRAAGETDRLVIAINLAPSLLERGELSGQASVQPLASITTSDTKGSEWIPERMLKSTVLTVLPKAATFDELIYSTAAMAVEPTEVDVAIFSNDKARNFIAAGPITIYAPARK